MVIQELMGPVEIPFNWKELAFHRRCSVNIKSILETSLVAGGKESKEGRQTFFPTVTYQNRGELIITAIGDTTKICVYWVKFSRAQDQWLQF